MAFRLSKTQGKELDAHRLALNTLRAEVDSEFSRACQGAIKGLDGTTTGC